MTIYIYHLFHLQIGSNNKIYFKNKLWENIYKLRFLLHLYSIKETIPAENENADNKTDSSNNYNDGIDASAQYNIITLPKESEMMKNT